MIVEREGYCYCCANNPSPEGSLVEASKEQGNPCNGCWFVDEKPNWVDAAAEGGKGYYE